MIIKKDFWYPPAGENRKLHIYLPDNYTDTQERYPVMYFFDGHNLYFNQDATYGKSWGMKEFLDGWDKKMIMVGLECGHKDGQRLSEYLPYPAVTGAFRSFEPRGEETMQWIVNEVKPFIDQAFRTWSHREATAIGGSSMGGIMAIYGLVHYNHVFSKGACVSSAIGFCMPSLMNEMSDAVMKEDTKAWLSWGTKEAKGADDTKIDSSSYTYRRNKAVENKFLAKNCRPQLYCQLGGGHCEADWEKQVPLFMNFLWK